MIHLLDLNFQGQDHAIAAFLVETSAGAVLVESGPYSVFKNLEKAVANVGFQLSDIRHVLLTHIHFDHAGGAWALAQQGATIYLHPFGKRHLAEPSKLWASAKRIYQDMMETLWGDMQPIAEDRLRTVEHGETITIGDTDFTAWHTPGHAVHHIAWQVGSDLFTGDVAGVKIGNGMVVPPCPPPDINVEDWQASLRLIKNLKVERLYLTHFNAITEVEAHLDAVEAILLDWAAWMRPHWERGESPAAVTPKFQAYAKQQLLDFGVSPDDVGRYELANPAWMSVAGLLRYWQKWHEAQQVN